MSWKLWSPKLGCLLFFFVAILTGAMASPAAYFSCNMEVMDGPTHLLKRCLNVECNWVTDYCEDYTTEVGRCRERVINFGPILDHWCRCEDENEELIGRPACQTAVHFDPGNGQWSITCNDNCCGARLGTCPLAPAQNGYPTWTVPCQCILPA